MRKIDLTGLKFGRLTVLYEAPPRYTQGGQKICMYQCKCECGNYIITQARSLRDGKTQSCGCLHKEKLRRRMTKHGESRSHLYAVHRAMKQRCENPNDPSYKWYGERGITVCEEWKSYDNFQKWAQSSGYTPGLTIERKNVNGNYCPENCTWITIQEQQQNRRKPVRTIKE